MTAETHSQLANFIWSICNLLRGPYKRNEYRKVILPLTVLRRFDCLLEPTKAAVLAEYPSIKSKPETVLRSLLQKITKRPFYNLSKLDFKKLLDDPNQLAPNLNSYINKFSPNVRAIIERFGFDEHVARMAEKNLLYEVIKAFAKIDLSSSHIDNVQMGYVFEELIRVGAEQANEEAGEHFTPREVIKLMVNLLLSPEKDLTHSHVVKTIYDPACGTGGMLSVSEQYIHELNSEAKPMLYGQDWNDDAWAVCKSDMLIKGEDADNLSVGGAVKELVVSKTFDNADFGFHKITVERPLRLTFEITNEKLDALEHGTTAIAKIDKLPAETREHVVEQLRAKARPGVLKSRDAFDDWLKHALPGDQYITKSLRILLRDAFSERDETAEICTDSRGKAEPDPDLRDTENVPLKEKIEDYFESEVLPHVPDAWIDESKTKIGYEIPLNRHFYCYEPPRALEEIESDIKTLEGEILTLLKEVTA